MIRPYVTYQPRRNSYKIPKLLLIDISWIDYEHDLSHWFYKKFPPRSILEVITSVSTQEDYDPVFWGEVEERLTDDELQALDLFVVEVLVHSIIDSFYGRLNTLIQDNVDRFIFHRWIDKNTIALIRNDLTCKLEGIHATFF